jgi:anti-anti-sigma regulatory factor
MSCRILVENAATHRLLRLEGSDFLPAQQAEFRSIFQELLRIPSSTPVLIDTTQLNLVGSCCLSSVIELAMLCHKQGIPAGIIETRSSTLDVYEVVSIHSILPVFLTVDEARSSLTVT